MLLLSYCNNDVMRCNIFFLFLYVASVVFGFGFGFCFLKDKNEPKRLDLESNFF
jgi:hypothetical protein